MTREERNAHYGKLNERFEERSAELRSMGYKYQQIPGMGIAVFTRTKHGKVKTVAAGTVLNADDVVWADTAVELY